MRDFAFLAAILSVVAGSVWAETAPKGVINAAPTYQSSFVDYHRFKDKPVESWPERNEAMQRLGGHMGHLNDVPVSSNAKPTGRERSDDAKTSEERKS